MGPACAGRPHREGQGLRAASSPALAFAPTRPKTSCMSGSTSRVMPREREHGVVVHERAAARGLLDGDRVARDEAAPRLEDDLHRRLVGDDRVGQRDVAPGEASDDREGRAEPDGPIVLAHSPRSRSDPRSARWRSRPCTRMRRPARARKRSSWSSEPYAAVFLQSACRPTRTASVSLAAPLKTPRVGGTSA